ncbi:MAG: hypothetical protein NTZ57_06225 [Deltaproteobacteria bacterium]|nr:hypothetical protein [Deltaproteobacteria bacterium]
MNHTLPMPQKLINFCETCARGLSERTEPEACIGFVSRLLPDIVFDKRLFQEILEGMVRGDDYLELRYATMFDSEVVLYRDPARLFSMRMFLWGPGEYDPIHDHNSWGVISPVRGELEVVNYLREDDGSKEDCARLKEGLRAPQGDGPAHHRPRGNHLCLRLRKHSQNGESDAADQHPDQPLWPPAD